MVLENDRYLLSGNIDPLQLVEKYGAPLYVYDTAIIERKYKEITSAFKVKDLRINYACKALTNINILKVMNSLGTGLDTVSVHEVKLGLRAGFSPSQIMYTPNCVGLEEIEEALALGVSITLDNTSILEQFGQAHPNVPVCLRINPHILAGGNLKTSTGHLDSKFGISFHQMPLVHRIVDATGLKVEGLHMHTGSDILDPDVFIAGADILLRLAKEFPDMKLVDLGSGFKVPYKEGDIYTDITELGAKLSERFRNFCKDYGRDLTLVFEPGKFLVSEAGFFLSKVNVVKQTISTVFAGLDTGLNHFIRPMFYNSYHSMSNLSNPLGKKRFYTVVGYICETDTFGVNRPIPEVREGDILCMHNAGAYCFSMASNYNSRLRPAEVMVHEGKDYLIREREVFDDLLRHQVEAPAFVTPKVKESA